MKQIVARSALVISLLVPVYFAVAALGVKFGLYAWQMGLGVLIVKWGPRVIIAALVIAVIALIFSLANRPRRGWVSAVIAVMIPALAFGYLGWVRGQSEDIPPIHDISTDGVNPPTYSATLMAARETVPNVNPVVSLTAPMSTLEKYRGPRFADMADQTLTGITLKSYPGIRPLTVTAAPDDAFKAALVEAERRGWTIVTQSPETGTLEATAETFWFGFKDDVAIRVSAADAGSVIDMRSTSRVGLSDLGANAARIESYLKALDAKL